MSKFHRELKRRLRVEGVTVTHIEQRNKSIVFNCEMAGRTLAYFTAISASDYRALENALREILRGLKEPSHAA